MKISVPIEENKQILLDHNVVDNTTPFDNAIRQNFPPFTNLQYTDSIYRTEVEINIPDWFTEGVYIVGDVVYKDGYIKKLEADTLGNVPKQPEDYDFETSFDHTVWDDRYMKLGGIWTDFDLDAPYSVEHIIGNDKIVHTISKNTNQQWEHETKAVIANTTGFIEETGDVNANGSTQLLYHDEWTDLSNIYIQDSVGANSVVSNSNYSKVLISYHDLSQIPDDAIIRGIEVTSRRKVEVLGPNNDGIRDYEISLYKNGAMFGSNKSSSSFWGLAWGSTTWGGPTDLWGHSSITVAQLKEATFGFGQRTYNSAPIEPILSSVDVVKMNIYYEPADIEVVIATTLPNIHLETSPSLYENKALITNPPVYQDYAHAFNTIFVRPDGVYGRTHTDAPIEYDEVVGTFFAIVESPAEIGFYFWKKSNIYRPFDGKNYTFAESGSDHMWYEIGTDEPFDTIAIGSVKAESITISFFDNLSNPIIVINDAVNTDRDNHKHLASWKTTLIYYSPYILEFGGSVRIDLWGTAVSSGTSLEVGTLLLGTSAEAGFTNLTLKNDYKDYSTFDYDLWGNADYVERAKVSRYNGTVDIEIENYDMTDRLMTSLGKNLVIINGSDKSSSDANSLTVFAATQKIGRFLSFSQQTKISDADIDVMATYSFTLEEIV